MLATEAARERVTSLYETLARVGAFELVGEGIKTYPEFALTIIYPLGWFHSSLSPL
jgi:hypothetical protein